MKKIIVLLVASFAVFSLSAAEQEVSITCPWGQISATLATPDGECDTALLIVAGSGPTDRNGNSAMGLNPWSYKYLSDALVEEGYAVLRYDKRAIGRSPIAAELIPELRFDDYVDDALTCVEYLGELGYQRVVIVGHSEGGLIAQVAYNRAPELIDGLVLLCAAGYPMDQLLTRQLEAQLMPDNYVLMISAQNVIRNLKSGREMTLERIPQPLQSLFHPSVQPFLINIMEYDPSALMQGVECPVFIVCGGRDIQVLEVDGEALHTACPEARYVCFESMCHVLKDATTEDRIEQLMGVYANSQLPLTEGLVPAISDFLREMLN